MDIEIVFPKEVLEEIVAKIKPLVDLSSKQISKLLDESNYSRSMGGGLKLYDAIGDLDLERLLIPGRILESDFHDRQPEHAHLIRVVLGTYNPKTQKVLVSKEGSRLRTEPLREPDKLMHITTLTELSHKMNYTVINPMMPQVVHSSQLSSYKQ